MVSSISQRYWSALSILSASDRPHHMFSTQSMHFNCTISTQIDDKQHLSAKLTHRWPPICIDPLSPERGKQWLGIYNYCENHVWSIVDMNKDQGVVGVSSSEKIQNIIDFSNWFDTQS